MALTFFIRIRKATSLAIMALGLTIAWFGVGRAQQSSFYKDKTIRIIVGFTSGGLYDQYARLLARHMGKYIPGNPNIIVQNMPGAGSLTSTNYVYSVAKPDGLTLGMPGSGIYLDQLLSMPERLRWTSMAHPLSSRAPDRVDRCYRAKPVSRHRSLPPCAQEAGPDRYRFPACRE